MSTTELSPQGNENKLAKFGAEQAKKARATYTARASSDFYGGIGWIVGLFLTLFVAIPAIWFLSNGATTRSAREQILIYGVAIAWWLNPLSLGALGYIFSNIRSWRFWTIPALIVWAGVNFLVSASIVSETARIMTINGLIIGFYILLALLFLYIQLRVFVWAAAGKPGRFFFGIMGWAALNGLIYWALISPEVLNIILVALGFVARILFAISFVVIQFVAIFWFMARSRVEIIRP